MFVSTKQLVNSYGIDDTIARFFVDREPPANNLYWHEKLLYLRPAPGYLFIPLIVDLLYKLGIDRQQLLSETFVSAMENVGHISALEETKKISHKEAIEQCAAVVKDISKNRLLLTNVMNYFGDSNTGVIGQLTTPFKALHRGDYFLFSLSALPFAETLFVKVAQQWFALISTLLLLDDAEDIQSDKASGDENAFIESGLNAAGVQRITLLVEQNIEKIDTVNATMARELERQYKERSQKPDILTLLND